MRGRFGKFRAAALWVPDLRIARGNPPSGMTQMMGRPSFLPSWEKTSPKDRMREPLRSARPPRRPGRPLQINCNLPSLFASSRPQACPCRLESRDPYVDDPSLARLAGSEIDRLASICPACLCGVAAGQDGFHGAGSKQRGDLGRPLGPTEFPALWIDRSKPSPPASSAPAWRV
jgi:hypothetical protein